MLAICAAQFKNTIDRVFDQIVRTGSAGSDADGDLLLAGQFIGVALLFPFLMDVKVDDRLECGKAVGGADEKSGKLLLANLDEVSGVGTVVPTDNEENIQRQTEQIEQGVLSLLGGPADGIKDLEMTWPLIRSVAVDDGLLQAALNLLRF